MSRRLYCIFICLTEAKRNSRNYNEKISLERSDLILMSSCFKINSMRI